MMQTANTEQQQLLQQAKELGLDLLDEKFAHHLDHSDPLRSYRDSFYVPTVGQIKSINLRQEKEVEGKQKEKSESSSVEPTAIPTSIYLCGHSLGLQPKKVRDYLQEELDVWAQKGVCGHFLFEEEKKLPLSAVRRPWLTTDEYVYKLMAKLVGAQPEEVAIMNSLTTNLHLMMVPFYRPTKERHKILIEKRSFPSDLYAVESQILFHGFDPKTSLIEIEGGEEGKILPIPTEKILKRIEEEGNSLALVLLSGVQYLTGQFFDIQAIVEAGHRNGAVVGFDLAHAVGNVPLQLHNWGVDFAVWCSYKYLNSGPGGIGGCFVHSNHATNSLPRFAGWWGHDHTSRFEMNSPFSPIPGAFGYRLSNPPVLCVASLLASLEIFDQAGMEKLSKKSKLLTGYLELLMVEKMKGKVQIITPSEDKQRGCQISVRFLFDQSAKEVEEKLFERGIVCDVRHPNIMRVAPVPLYNSFMDVRNFVKTFVDLFC